MKIRRFNWFVRLITFNRAAAISLFPFGLYIKTEYMTDWVINHESIHWKQQAEMLGIFFYLWYLLEWIIRIPINGRKAYKSIGFEREAYFNDDNLDYLKNRKRYSWIGYLCTN